MGKRLQSDKHKMSKWPIRILTTFGKGFVAIYALLLIQISFYDDYSVFVYGMFGFIAVVIAFYGKRQNNKVKQKTTMKQKGMAFIYGCLIIACGVLLQYVLTGEPFIIHAYQITPSPQSFYVCLIAPVGEEVIYRQMLYSDAFGNHAIGRIISGALFILIHFPTTIPTFLFYLIATIGLFVAYEKSGKNIMVSTAVHITNNVFAFI